MIRVGSIVKICLFYNRLIERLEAFVRRAGNAGGTAIVTMVARRNMIISNVDASRLQSMEPMRFNTAGRQCYHTGFAGF